MMQIMISPNASSPTELKHTANEYWQKRSIRGPFQPLNAIGMRPNRNDLQSGRLDRSNGFGGLYYYPDLRRRIHKNAWATPNQVDSRGPAVCDCLR